MHIIPILVALVLLVALFYAVYVVLNWIPVPQQLKTLCYIILFVIAFVIVIEMLMPGTVTLK